MARPINVFDVDVIRSKGNVETRRIRLVQPENMALSVHENRTERLQQLARIAAINGYRADNGLSTNVTVLAMNVRLVSVETPAIV